MGPHTSNIGINQRRSNRVEPFVVSGIRRDLNGNCVVLFCDAAGSGDFLAMSRCNVWVWSSGSRNGIANCCVINQRGVVNIG